MNQTIDSTAKKNIIKSFYFYAVSFVALMMFVISTVNVVSTATRLIIAPEAGRYGYSPVYVGPECDGPSVPTSTQADCAKRKEEAKQDQSRQQKAQNYSDISSGVALIILSIPLFIFHYRGARRIEKE